MLLNTHSDINLDRFPDDLPFTCKICTDPLAKTYDGAYTMILTEQKTLLSVWDDDNLDSCKFQIRSVTTDDCAFDDMNEPLFLDWIGVALDVHKNPAKNLRNWIFGQTYLFIGERGQGFVSSNFILRLVINKL